MKTVNNLFEQIVTKENIMLAINNAAKGKRRKANVRYALRHQEEIAERLRKKLLDGVCITGGEPTIQKDLKDFIRKVKDLGLSVKLDTNGSNPEVIKELLDEHLIDYIAMDIKTVFSKYSEVANRNVDIDSLRSSIELIKNSNIDYEFRTTVVKAFVSYEDLVFILDYLDCKKYYLQKFEDRQSNIVYHLEAYSDDELKEIYSKLKEKYDFIKIRGLR